MLIKANKWETQFVIQKCVKIKGIIYMEIFVLNVEKNFLLKNGIKKDGNYIIECVNIHFVNIMGEIYYVILTQDSVSTVEVSLLKFEF